MKRIRKAPVHLLLLLGALLSLTGMAFAADNAITGALATPETSRATVNVRTDRDSIVIVATRDENGKILGIGSAPVSAIQNDNPQAVTVQVSAPFQPGFHADVFLLDAQTSHPLCGKYEAKDITQDVHVIFYKDGTVTVQHGTEPAEGRDADSIQDIYDIDWADYSYAERMTVAKALPKSIRLIDLAQISGVWQPSDLLTALEEN